jgi:hypothetical protein
MRAVTVLNMLHDLPTDDQDPDDPVTFINTDIKAAFQEMCRQTSFDTITGKATQPYTDDDGQVQPGERERLCCLLVLDSVTSAPQCICQPRPRVYF